MADLRRLNSKPAPAPVTVARVLRLRELLGDLGVAVKMAADTPPATSMAEAMAQQAKADAPTQIDIAGLEQLLWDEGRVTELCDILFDFGSEVVDAEAITVEDIESALIPFFLRFNGLTSMLASYGSGWA